ncbi:SpoVA/SpoVAEb family sporulation membrane protein [Evansella halocellulosilytica]|uniref:SpoVA/SpoVAEb family sporulation membrane protein n=1 Tax=Evansella halocellulosilytica TaxID=2011013 RepID=UPI000BB700EE|nr:SpoVA/SpoVAEb family sporulation membrane protein [Evansella halocellulosilytica]
MTHHLSRKFGFRIVKNKKLLSFLVGGAISLIGQIIVQFSSNVATISSDHAHFIMYITFILLGSILTSFGYYSRWTAKVGAGLVIPITGIANLFTSMALDGKNEGGICGISHSLFKHTGSIIIVGALSSFFGAVIYYLINL